MKSYFANFISAIGFIFTLAILAQAAPTNDNFANAQLLGGNVGTVSGTNVGASKEFDEKAHAKNRGGASVWYKYIAPGNGVLTIDTIGSNFDTLLAVYVGTNQNDLKLIAANDDAAGGTASRVIVGTQLNATYYIAVDGKNVDNAGAANGNIFVNFLISNTASNDNFANATLLSGASGKMFVTSNVGASKESGEPIILNNQGGKSVWFKWTSPANAGKKCYSFTLESKNLTGTNTVNALFGVYKGAAVNSLEHWVSNSGTGVKTLQFCTSVSENYYISIDGFDSGTGAETGTFTLSYGVTRSGKQSDFDRDGKADLTIFRPLTGTWFSMDSITEKWRVVPFGTNGDKPMLFDFDQDGELDYTVFRPDTGTWFINRTQAGFQAFNYGTSGDTPLIHRSFDNGSVQVFRANTGVWWQYYPQNNSAGNFKWGQSGDIPVLVNYNTGAWDKEAVFRPSTGSWYIFESPFAFYHIQFGMNGDKPVAADFDGDGYTDIAVYRPSTGVWYIRRSSDLQVQIVKFGISTDIPQPADYDGDERDDIAVWRPQTGVWYILQSSNGQAKIVQYGSNGDIPVTYSGVTQ